MKKIFTLFLALIASVSAIYAQSGTCGDNLRWTLSNGTLTISGTGAMQDYEYYPDVPWYYDRSSIRLVIISDGVTSIGDYAFYGCSILTSVTIGNGVTSIREWAFAGCSYLKSVTIPNSVTSIGRYAFRECKSLTSVTIGNSVTSIGNYAFENCSSLTSINVDSNNPNYSSVDGVLFNKDKTTLVAYPGGKQGAYTIPNSVTSIGEYAFYGCSSLISITIPNSVTSIGNWAFDGCKSLTSITIPNSVTSIGRGAFYECSGLTSVTIPNSVTSIGGSAFFNVLNIEYHGMATGAPWGARVMNGYVEGNLVYEDSTKTTLLFCSNHAQGEIIIPNTVTNIGDYAFSDCSFLTSVTIPNSVTSIGSDAFANCSSLDSLTIGNGVTSIGGDGAFEGCNTLTYLAINSPKIVSESYMLKKLGPCRGAENMIIGDDVKYIVGGAFRNCGNLRSLTIGNGITSISKGAFEYCYIEDLTIGNSVTIIEERAFNGNGINHVIIPNSVRYIGEEAFYGDCSRVTLKPDTPPALGGLNVFRCHQGPTIYVSCKAYESYIKNDKWKMYKDDIESIPINKVEGKAKDKNTGKVSVSSTSSFDCQAQIKFTAIPNKGYKFIQWSDGVVNNPRSIVLTQDTVLIAEFAEIPSYVVEVIYNTDHGTVNGQGTYKEDEEVTLTATANDGYKFHKWSNGVTDNPYTFFVKSDVTLEAKFTSTEGIADVLSSEVHTTKVIRDGQVLILRNGKTYTMQGQEVK